GGLPGTGPALLRALPIRCNTLTIDRFRHGPRVRTRRAQGSAPSEANPHSEIDSPRPASGSARRRGPAVTPERREWRESGRIPRTAARAFEDSSNEGIVSRGL